MLPEIRAYMAKARLRRGIEMVKLANRIESLKMQEDEEEEAPQAADVPAGALQSAGDALAHQDQAPIGSGGLQVPEDEGGIPRKRSMSKLAKSAIFREVVLAKVREAKADEEKKKIEAGLSESGNKHH